MAGPGSTSSKAPNELPKKTPSETGERDELLSDEIEREMLPKCKINSDEERFIFQTIATLRARGL
jgi:hypothetical protein